MNAICPITDKMVNERVARLNGFITVVFMIIVLATSFKWLVFFLIPDFLIRGFLNQEFSYLSQMNSAVAKGLNFKEQKMNAGPKIFAARVGFLFTVAIAVLYFSGFEIAGAITAGTLLLFSALEAFAGFCVACKLYPFLYGIFYKR